METWTKTCVTPPVDCEPQPNGKWKQATGPLGVDPKDVEVKLGRFHSSHCHYHIPALPIEVYATRRNRPVKAKAQK